MSLIDFYKTRGEFDIINYYNITIYNERLINDIKNKMIWYHMGLRYPIKAEIWEDIFDQCINPEGSKWIGGGHQSGADTQHIQTKMGFQNKSGQINGNTVSITSHRTKNVGPSIDEKLNFICKADCDKYVLLSRDEKEWKKNIKSYYLMIFDRDRLNFRELEWSEHIPKQGKNKGKHNGGYIGNGDINKFSAKIDGPGSSNQLHISINIDYIGGYHKFIIP